MWTWFTKFMSPSPSRTYQKVSRSSWFYLQMHEHSLLPRIVQFGLCGHVTNKLFVLICKHVRQRHAIARQNVFQSLILSETHASETIHQQRPASSRFSCEFSNKLWNQSLRDFCKPESWELISIIFSAILACVIQSSSRNHTGYSDFTRTVSVVSSLIWRAVYRRS
jgi:hypothetical protein